jgi:hypothetical protein
MIKYENGDIIIQIAKDNPVTNLAYDFFDKAIWMTQNFQGKGSEASRAIHAMIVSDAQPGMESRLIEATNQNPGGVIEWHKVDKFDKSESSLFEYRVFRCSEILANKQKIGDHAQEIARHFLGSDYGKSEVAFSPLFKKNFGPLAKQYVEGMAKKMFTYDEMKSFGAHKNPQTIYKLNWKSSSNVKKSMFCSQLVVICYQLALISKLPVPSDEIEKMEDIMPLDAQNCSPGSLFQFLLLEQNGWSEVK